MTVTVRALLASATLAVAAGASFEARAAPAADATLATAGQPRAVGVTCRPGSRRAVIGGRVRCLRAGQRCVRSLDRQYHRAGFHCHAGTLVRTGPRGEPSRPPVPVEAISVAVVGAAQTVFDWTTQRCDDEDIPDQPARAFRDARGRTQLIASHFVARREVGLDLDRLAHDCRAVKTSHRSPRPESFDNDYWLTAPYTEDGQVVYALMHNEFHGENAGPGMCPSLTSGRCWYGALTFAVSTDAGDNYFHPPPPSHLVASLPVPYVPDRAGIGYGNGTNVVKNPRDGFYYALINQHRPGTAAGICVMRTRTLARPDSWRAWDGRAFGHRFVNPYVESLPNAEYHHCLPVFSSMLESLSWNTQLRRWLAFGTREIGPRGPGQRAVFFFAVSDDLVRWSEPVPVLEVETVHSYRCGDGDPDPKAYPSFVDPDSPARNFDVSGGRGWLYYTQFNYRGCTMTLDRDLIRVPVEIRVER